MNDPRFVMADTLWKRLEAHLQRKISDAGSGSHRLHSWRDKAHSSANRQKPFWRGCDPQPESAQDDPPSAQWCPEPSRKRRSCRLPTF